MELKEYYKTLEMVLTHLHANPDAKTDEVKALSGGYWGKVKEYLKENKVAGFILGGELWWMNAPRLEKCLAEVRITLKEYDNEKSDKRRNVIKQILIPVATTVIISLGSTIFYRSCQNDASTNSSNNKAEHSGNDIRNIQESFQSPNDSI